MARCKKLLAVGVILCRFWCSGYASGQDLGGMGGLGGIGGAAGAANGIAPVAASAAPAVAAPRTIWSFFGLSSSNLAACKQKFCASQLGQMANNGMAPVSALTGGVLGQFCPTVPTAAQAAALAAAGGPTGAEAVAAKIKQDEADAKARRAAVRYLSTADCHYWPEAEAAIIGALRDDRNECVRYEAALALLNGCCCTAKTIEALKIVVDGTEKDGKPSETSERVRGVAFSALQGCLARYHPPAAAPIPLERPEPASATLPVQPLPAGFRRLAYYYQTLKDVPPALIVAEATRTLEKARTTPKTGNTVLVTGKRSVYDALARAVAEPVDNESSGTATASAAPPRQIPLILEEPTIEPVPPQVPAAELPVLPTEADLPPTAPPPPSELARGAVEPVALLPPLPEAFQDRPRRDTSLATTSRPAPAEPATPSGKRNLRDIFLNSISHSSPR